MVDTKPDVETARSTWFCWSATMSVAPSAAKATADGAKKRAEGPAPPQSPDWAAQSAAAQGEGRRSAALLHSLDSAVRELRGGDVAPPREERVLLGAVQRLGRRDLGPARPPRDGQVAHGARRDLGEPRRGHRPEAPAARGGPAAVVDERHLPALGREDAVGHRRDGHELLHAARLRDGLQGVRGRLEVRHVEARVHRLPLRALVETEAADRRRAERAAGRARGLARHLSRG
jgi:hypothetical protein